MAENQVGTIPVAWALPSGLTITGYTTILPQGYTLSKEADEATVRNARGQTVTEIFFDHRQLFSLEMVVGDATNIAGAKAAQTIPDSGGIVTVGDSATPDDDPELSADHGGKYVVVRAQKVASNSSEVKISLELRQRRDVDIAQAIS